MGRPLNDTDEIEEWNVCQTCGGEGVDGHDCGEDTCPCALPEENMRCQTCDGEGGWTIPLERDRGKAAVEEHNERMAALTPNGGTP